MYGFFLLLLIPKVKCSIFDWNMHKFRGYNSTNKILQATFLCVKIHSQKGIGINAWCIYMIYLCICIVPFWRFAIFYIYDTTLEIGPQFQWRGILLSNKSYLFFDHIHVNTSSKICWRQVLPCSLLIVKKRTGSTDGVVYNNHKNVPMNEFFRSWWNFSNKSFSCSKMRFVEQSSVHYLCWKRKNWNAQVSFFLCVR